MISRFGISSPTSKEAAPAAQQTQSSSSSSSSSSTYGSMSMNMNFMKKMSAGLSMPSLDTTAMIASMATISSDNKRRSEQEELRAKIAQTMAILEDVHLQAPANHSGMILAYTAKNMAPIASAGVKFRWYRLPVAGGGMVPVQESQHAWYAPCVDDIGCVICAQCEDTFDQDLSKFLECGPIKPDPLLTTLTESALSNGVFEVKGVAVSLGLSVADSSLSSNESTAQQDTSTALAKSSAFLQLNGTSTIEVDEEGVFISIPTPASSSSNNNNNGNNKSSAEGKGSLNTSRRGLRIPASASLRVSCAQPSFLLLSLPLARKTVTHSHTNSHVPVGDEDSETTAPVTDSPFLEEEKDSSADTNDNNTDSDMKSFLSSSIQGIPWTYEGHTLSPAAYISGAHSEDREREAEEDSVDFASTVASLAEFISSVPDGASELLLCFACDSRLHRDALALSIRALAAQPVDATKVSRTKALPWAQTQTQAGEGEEALAWAEHSEVDNELKLRLKKVEEENSALKREKNELAKQLLQAKEEISVAKTHSPSVKTSSTDDQSDAPIASAVSVETNAEEMERMRELSAKVIELENKLSIITKREAEAAKARTDVETKSAKQQQEIDRLKTKNGELSAKTKSMQIHLDQRTASVKALEEEREKYEERCAELEQRLKDSGEVQQELMRRENQVAELEKLLEEERSERSVLKDTVREHKSTIEQLQTQLSQAEKKLSVCNEEFDNQLSSSVVENKRLEREIAVLQDRLQSMESTASRVKSLEEQLLAAQEKADNLTAEMNHLQRKSESQTKDMKKMMKENSQTLLEFERALAMKNGECNELSTKVEELEREMVRMQNNNSSGSTASVLLRQFSSSMQRPSITEGSSPSMTSAATSMLRRLSISSRTDIPDSTSLGDN